MVERVSGDVRPTLRPAGRSRRTPLTSKDALAKHHSRREVYIDVFRGLMALFMVQGHVCDTLLSPQARLDPLYQFQTIFHGSTAPGFLFASGFVAGLPRAPLSLRGSLRRARRLLFVWGVGYFLHLPYWSFWKTLTATPAEKALLLSCDALQVIAATQLFVILLQGLFRARWPLVGGLIGLSVLAAGPGVWASGIAARLPPAIGPYLDVASGSHFPVFPFAAFVLGGTIAGATIGRQEPRTRRRRATIWGLVLLLGGWLLSFPLSSYVDFWGVSPAYALMRLGALLLVLRLVESVCAREWAGVPQLALLGHETLQVFVFHLMALYGGVVVPGPLSFWIGRLGFATTTAVLLVLVPVLYLTAWVWHRFKMYAPHEATMLLTYLGTLFLFEFFTRSY